MRLARLLADKPLIFQETVSPNHAGLKPVTRRKNTKECTSSAAYDLQHQRDPKVSLDMFVHKEIIL
jgi:hypothetical protein